MHFGFRIQTALLLPLALAVSLPAGLSHTAQAQDTTTIKVESRLVLLDASVTDKQGKPVTDLKPEEFRVFEKKTEQKILSFEPPSQHTVPADLAGKMLVNSTADLAKIGDAPVTILVLDELNMNSQDSIYARDKLIQWLSRQPAILPQPTALSAITYTTFELLRDFTQDRDALLTILKKHSGGVMWRSENSGRVGPQASENMFSSLGALERISQAMRGVPGRKNLIWVGDGFPSVNFADTTRTTGEEIATALRRLTNVMLKARVTLSIIGPALKGYQPTVIETQSDADSAANSNFDATVFSTGNLTFGGLAPPTGGHAFSGRNDMDAEIGLSVTDGLSYYTLSYRPSEPNDDPKEFRDIHVEVTRPGLIVQTRSGYFGEPKQPPALGKAESQQLAFDLNGAATSPLSFTDLHLTVDHDNGENYTVHAAAKDMTWWNMPDGRRHADLVILTACLSQSGKLLSRNFTLLGSNTEASLAAINQVTTSLHVKVAPPRGTARIRFVVREMGGGRVGTTDLRP